MGSVIWAVGLTKQYGDQSAVDGISLEVSQGESVAIMGPSGSGKTTLMHLLSGILSPDQGEVRLRDGSEDGVVVSALSAEKRARLRREHIGFVFQEGLLMRELTARENVAVPLMPAGTCRFQLSCQ